MAQFLIKVNPSKCPNGNGQPSNSAEWESGWFDVLSRTRPYRDLNPRRYDCVLIWVNEKSRTDVRGTGLVAIAIVEAVRTSSVSNEIQISNPHFFPRPLVDQAVIAQYMSRHAREGTDHIIVRANNDRHRTLYHLSDADFDELVRPHAR